MADKYINGEWVSNTQYKKLLAIEFNEKREKVVEERKERVAASDERSIMRKRLSASARAGHYGVIASVFNSK